MREILLSESDRKRFDEFPADISQDDLIVFFTLSIIDKQVISNRRGAGNRLGFAVQLCAVRYLGYCPGDYTDIPESIVVYIADQLDMEDSDNLIKEYGNRHQTRTDHLQEIISFIGFKKPRQKDFESLGRWLTERALEHDKPVFLFSLACEHLYKIRLLRPGITVLERLIVSARRQARQQTYNKMVHLLKPDVRIFLDKLLTVDEETGRTPFYWLKFGATANKPTDILNDIDKLEYLNKHNVRHWKITGLNSNKLKFLAQRARRSTNQSLQRSMSERRYPILVAFVLRSYEEITDELIELYDRCLLDCYARAKGDLKRFQLSISRSTNEKLRILKNIGDVVLNAGVSDSEVRKNIYTVISEQDFRQTIDECGRLMRPKNDKSYDFLGKRYSYIRVFSPRFLKIIRFSSNRKNDPIINAVSVLNKVNDENKRIIPDDAPTEFIQKSWLPYIKDAQGKIVRRYYEISVLWSLRGALRSGDVWVNHSRRHADPESYLIPKELWSSMKEDACKILGLPLTADTRLEAKQQELEAAYRELDEKIGRQDGVGIEGDKLSLTRLKAEEIPISAKKLQADITRRLPKIDIADLLIEVEQWTHYRDDFEHASKHQTSNPQNLQLLYASILAQANNYGMTKMAEVSDIPYSQLAWFNKWHIREDCLQKGINRLVNYQFRLPLAKHWGGGAMSSSDGQRFPVAVKARNSAVVPRYGYGRILTFYSWTSDQHSQWRCAPEPPLIRDATYVLDGLLDNETELPLHEHTTDTAGYTEKIFAFFDGLGFLFSPRIRDLKDQNIYCIDKTIRYKNLRPIIKGNIRTSIIEKHWDAILRVFASLKLGWVTASLFIHKLQSQPKQSELAKAIHEYGKLIKSIHIPKYVCQEDRQRRVSKQLNKGEALHDLRQWLLFANEGELQQSQLQDQASQAGALTLVTNAVIVWNTVYMQAVIKQLKKEGDKVDDIDLQHISPCRFEHINKHGKLTFNIDQSWKHGQLRPLRKSPDN